MAGFSLFSGYQKPGPGINKNEPQKPPVSKFFELLFRKFFYLIKLNFLFLIPFTILGALAYFTEHLTGQALVGNLFFILLMPFVAGLTFVTRNCAREEHSFLLSDFKDAVFSNWKQFFIHGCICYILYNLIVFCIRFYYTLAASQEKLFMVPFGISVAALLIFAFMQYYIPLMIITFDLNLKQIYKNGLIFAIVGLWRNILLTVIFGAILFLNYFLYYLYPMLILLIDGIMLAFLAFSVSSFLINFTVYPLVETLMIRPALEPDIQNSAEQPKEGGEEPPQSAEQNGGVSDMESKYTFHDGKLVKKNQPENKEGSVFQDKG